MGSGREYRQANSYQQRPSRRPAQSGRTQTRREPSRSTTRGPYDRSNYARSKRQSPLQGRLPFIIAGIVIIVILVFIVRGCASGCSSEDAKNQAQTQTQSQQAASPAPPLEAGRIVMTLNGDANTIV